jgi:hypothetical protein
MILELWRHDVVPRENPVVLGDLYFSRDGRGLWFHIYVGF